MRLLFLASRPPYPPLQGDRLRAYHFLRHLRKRHHITLVAPVPHPLSAEENAANAALAARWVPVPLRRSEQIRNLLAFLGRALPLQTLLFATPSLRRVVRTLLEQEPFDLVHVQLARVAPAVPETSPIPRVLDFIDALSLNMARRAQQESWPRNWLFRWEARRMAAYERRLVRLFTQQVITSATDKAAIGDFPTLHVIPNGVDVEQFPFHPGPRQPGLIVFTGRMGYFPNEEAAVFFATQVFPRIRARYPEARFVIVGADPSPRVRSLASQPGITVTGFVPRVQDYLARAWVAVAPLQAGTGIQNKVLEAMAMGAPVVATPYALGGIAARAGEHVLVASTPEQLATAVLQVLTQPDLARRLAQAGRAFVTAHHSWEEATARLEAVYAAARAQARPAPED